MIDFEKFGRIWLASSLFTNNFQTIKEAIDVGVDTVVLKTTTSLSKKNNKTGIRFLKKGGILELSGIYFLQSNGYQGEYHLNDTLSCRSTSLDIEMLSVNETEFLYDKIKLYSPSTNVIISFAPMKDDDFEILNNMPGDGVEINTRWFPLNLERPYIANVFLPENYNSKILSNNSSIYWKETLKSKTPRELIDECVLKSKKYADENKRKFNFFKEGLPKLRKDRLTLIKLARQYWEMDFQKYIELDNYGFTFFDSQKEGLSTSISGVQIDVFGKGSTSGGSLTEMTLSLINILRNQNNDKYISASGGIMNPDHALKAFENGANSVQICSAIYFGGFKRLNEIVSAIKNKYYN